MAKYAPDERHTCIHCQTVVRFEQPGSGNWNSRIIAENEQVDIIPVQCPNCLKITITVVELIFTDSGYKPKDEHILWPRSGGRAPAPIEVPEHIRSDYNEASLVLNLSPKASAALSRRCLQSVLKEAGKTRAKDLSKQ
ncbi:MAG: DUF4145 domain-containing protein, partial [Candidatus Promineifilaceae bacterium]|nr:DUF4145 domain-containing protein [Candidatus Promineifilaceae bacterium]